MKKLFFLSFACALMLLSACGDDNNGISDSLERTVTRTMVTHVYNTSTNEIYALASAENSFSFQLSTLKGTAQLVYSLDGGATKQSATINNVTMTLTRTGVYALSASNTGNITDFSGYIDFNESALRFNYTVDGNKRVIATQSEIFFLACVSQLNYTDSTSSATDAADYQFEINPTNMTATVKIMELNDQMDVKFFNSITAAGATVTTTATGYEITANALQATTIYRGYDAETGSETTTSSEYGIANLHATIDLEQNYMQMTYKLGKWEKGSYRSDIANVNATGTVYALTTE